MRLALTVLCVAAAAQDAPVRTPPPGPPYAHYGSPQPVELSSLILGGNTNRAVIARGDLSSLDIGGQYFELRDGGTAVVVIPVGEMGGSVRELLGRRVEVTGLVRDLVAAQGTCLDHRRQLPASYCQNPDLPPTPDLAGDRAGWPKVSITAWSISDVSTLEPRRGGLERQPLAALLASADLPAKDVRVAGRFCGANLCGGMGPAPEPSAWAVEEDGTALWVVGKEPKGKGWRLDPSYRGDTARWVEVVGRLQPCGGGRRCLRARTVSLVSRPSPPSP